ncbi:MAG: phage integrase N-terminal SAM-like domain-containing protein, partial [Bacteroidota bacterium]|nr:phage integrase N-terminal SAM-like domain-containing protein [Bacteroidota bacterium]
MVLHTQGLFATLSSEMRLRGYSHKTFKAYKSWLRNLTSYFSPRHPRELTNDDIRNYLLHLIDEKKLAASTVNQAFNAIRFLYVELYKKSFVID